MVERRRAARRLSSRRKPTRPATRSGCSFEPIEAAARPTRRTTILRAFAERDVDQRRRIDVDVKQIGHHAADFAERPVRDRRGRRRSTSFTPPSGLRAARPAR